MRRTRPLLPLIALYAGLTLSPGLALSQIVVRNVTFAQADTDGNGYLTRDEARGIGIEDSFADLDQNSDNRVDSAEFSVVVRAPGVVVIPESAEQIPAVPPAQAGPPTAGGVTR